MPDQQLVTPRAARLRRPSWKDTRLIVGVLLVLGSILLGSAVVSAADDRVPVYAAARTLVPGEKVTEKDLVRVDVQLAEGGPAYLAADGTVPGGMVATRTVGKGELLPQSAVGSVRDADVEVVSVPVDAASATGLAAGDVVTVWASRGAGAGSRRPGGAPTRLGEMVVDEVVQEQGGIVGGGSAVTPVRLVVTGDAVEELEAFIHDDATITLTLPRNPGGTP